MNNSPRLWSTLTHMAALVGYLGIPFIGHVAGPLVVWLAKRSQVPEIDETAKDALNFHITACVYFFGVLLVTSLLRPLTLGIAEPLVWVLIAGFMMAHLVFTIAGIVAVDATGRHQYPYTIRFLR